mgnify:CR=1 FL=1
MIDDDGELQGLVPRSKKACLGALGVYLVELGQALLARHILLEQAMVCIIPAVAISASASESALLARVVRSESGLVQCPDHHGTKSIMRTHLDHRTSVMMRLLDLLDIIKAERYLSSWSLGNDKAVPVTQEGNTWTVIRRFRPRLAPDGRIALLLGDRVQDRTITVTELNCIHEA